MNLEIFSNYMEAPMVKRKTNTKGRWLIIAFMAIASLIFTGCDNGSLGLKSGSITGYILNVDTNQPVSEVLVTAKGTVSGGTENRSTYTTGDGSFVLADLKKGSWAINVEKFGFIIATDSAEIAHRTVEVNNGETVSAPVIKLHKTEQLVRGVLKGYPVDAVTGRPLSKFTVTQATPYNQRKSKTFETAADFRDSGWTNLDGGDHHYTITAPNYKEYSTAGDDGNGKQISIGAAAANMGTIYVEPLTVSISGALKLPGYVLDAENQNIAIWAEAAGKRVASFTTTAAEGDFFNGSLNFTLDKVPVTAGSVAVKCKVRGYDIVNLQSTLAITSANPGGTIAIGETDFINNVTPITRDVRVVLRSTKPDDGEPGTFVPGNVAKIYVKQGGETTSTNVTVVSSSYYAEAYISNVITGYPLVIQAQNITQGYYSVESDPVTIPEDGTSAFTVFLQLQD